MLFLERDPLVISEWTRDIASAGPGGDGPGGVTLSSGPRKVTLLLWMTVVALTQFDRGAAAVASMDLGAWQGGVDQVTVGFCVALMAGHSVGLALGGLLAGLVFQRHAAKKVLVLSLLVHALALLGLSVRTQRSLEWQAAAALRMVSGFASAMPLAYLPLWVDEFSPTDSQTLWMALVQVGGPVGQFLGIAVAGTITVTARTSVSLDWRAAFFVQAVLLVPVVLRIVFVPSMQVDVRMISTRARMDSMSVYPHDDPQSSLLASMLEEMREMLQGASRSPLNVAMATAMLCLHTASSGVCLWSAPWLALGSDVIPPITALLFQAFAFVAAPLAGNYAGAVLCDRSEGFKAGHTGAALRVGCGFFALAASAGPLTSCIEGYGQRMFLLVLWLFGCGGFLPIATGVVMTTMPTYLRSFATATFTLVIHLISYCLVPIGCGFLMSLYDDAKSRISFAMRFSLWVAPPGLLFLGAAYLREPRRPPPHLGLASGDDLTFGEISYELSRRRMTTSPI